MSGFSVKEFYTHNTVYISNISLYISCMFSINILNIKGYLILFNKLLLLLSFKESIYGVFLVVSCLFHGCGWCDAVGDISKGWELNIIFVVEILLTLNFHRSGG